MWNFFKIILKVLGTGCLLNGIQFELQDHYPKARFSEFAMVALFSWLIWKIWRKKGAENKIGQFSKKIGSTLMNFILSYLLILLICASIVIISTTNDVNAFYAALAFAGGSGYLMFLVWRKTPELVSNKTK